MSSVPRASSRARCAVKVVRTRACAACRKRLDFHIDDPRGVFAVLARGACRHLQEEGVLGRLEGREPQGFAHTVARDHVTDQVRGTLEVVLCPCGDLADGEPL
jgi:hypothetical protein